ncbi:hypothetical protein [Streptomyces olivaceus]|uniref:hypothetical protein n=1 Tax=Streptomyces olivaceus TaxID=47716 RepID=UPI001CCB2AA4|nr:hypothetical protein [Streptomyces olivaceus]MBZ6307340.1 hypothetical protein [Streptomyces olivaceus]MBZ6321235.1 hypothetical protein [Streptomyces olivaceus]
MIRDLAGLTITDYLDAAREMTAANRPYLAHLLAEEAARRTADPATAAGIRAAYPHPTAAQKETG